MKTLEELEKVAETARSRLVRRTGELDAWRESAERAEMRIVELTEDRKVTVQARLLLERFSEIEQQQLKARVESLVSAGLQTIFGEAYTFQIDVRMLRNQAAMEFTIVRDRVERDPMDSHGGGLVNVIALVLRLTIVALTPGLGRTVVLDEPFAQLSQGFLEGMGEFLRNLVDATDIQLIIVSHEPEIAEVADQAYRLYRSEGELKVERS